MKNHQAPKVSNVLFEKPWSWMTNSSQFAQDFPSVSTESLASQETPQFQVNSEDWSSYFLPTNIRKADCIQIVVPFGMNIKSPVVM